MRRLVSSCGAWGVLASANIRDSDPVACSGRVVISPLALHYHHRPINTHKPTNDHAEQAGTDPGWGATESREDGAGQDGDALMRLTRGEPRTGHWLTVGILR